MLAAPAKYAVRVKTPTTPVSPVSTASGWASLAPMIISQRSGGPQTCESSTPYLAMKRLLTRGTRDHRYLRRLQEAAAAAAAAKQEAQNGVDPSASPSSTHLLSPTHNASLLTPSTTAAPPSFLDSSLTPTSPVNSTAIPPLRYQISNDFRSQFTIPSSITAYNPGQTATNGNGNILPHTNGNDGVYGSPGEPFSAYPLHNWAYKQQNAFSNPNSIPPLSYCYRPHRLEDVAPRDTISLIIALFFDFVYPLTPCIHKPSFMADLAARREERDPMFFALVMSTVASTLVQVPRSYVPLDRAAVRKLAQTCSEASRHISVVSYDPPTSMHVIIRYLYVRSDLTWAIFMELTTSFWPQGLCVPLLRRSRCHPTCRLRRGRTHCYHVAHARRGGV